MWHLEPAAHTSPDIGQLLDQLNHEAQFFSKNAPLTIARAPGRLDLMGGIADYSGSLVLELPLALAAVAAVQADDAPIITIRSHQASGLDSQDEVQIALTDLAPDGLPVSYQQARDLLNADPRSRWAAYIAGVPLVLAHECGAALRGLRILIASDVPAGKGVSSSAAIEVAAMRAIAELLGVQLDGRQMALLCQMVENLVVGAPCGVMDQMTAACGQADALLALRCQPAELEPPIAIPQALEVWGIDSGIRHAVSGADYGSVRVGAFIGYRMIAELAGFPATPSCSGRVAISDPQFGGYLANITPSRWLHEFRDRLPEQINGAAFLERYGGTTDSVTHIDQTRNYAVRMPTEHPIHEHHRVEAFRTLLQYLATDQNQSTIETTARLLGELMYQSHASYSACGLGSDGTDLLVHLVRMAGAEAGLYGAKITGGGSGGTVAILARRGSENAIRAIATQYAAQSGREPFVIGGSSSGSIASGVFAAHW